MSTTVGRLATRTIGGILRKSVTEAKETDKALQSASQSSIATQIGGLFGSASVGPSQSKILAQIGLFSQTLQRTNR